MMYIYEHVSRFHVLSCAFTDARMSGKRENRVNSQMHSVGFGDEKRADSSGNLRGDLRAKATHAQIMAQVV